MRKLPCDISVRNTGGGEARGEEEESKLGKWEIIAPAVEEGLQEKQEKTRLPIPEQITRAIPALPLPPHEHTCGNGIRAIGNDGPNCTLLYFLDLTV